MSAHDILLTLVVVVPALSIILPALWFLTREMYKVRWLERHGRRVIAEVTQVTLIMKYEPEKLVIAKWTDPGTLETYTFRAMVEELSPLEVGMMVDVLVDPANPRRYAFVSATATNMSGKKRRVGYK